VNADNWVILITLVCYLLFMLWIGYRVSRRIRGVDSCILAGRNLPCFVLGSTFLATIANTNRVLGQPGFACQNGFTYLFWRRLTERGAFWGCLLLEPYRPESTSPEFREAFEGRTPGVPDTGLKVMGALWLVLILLAAYKLTVGSETAFPPLGSAVS
jgi:uncharacterized sodium:solute symporter family permease YidK